MKITSLFRLLITVMILSGIPLTANACTCWDPKPDEYLTAASLIFRGTVLSVEHEKTSEGKPTEMARAKFKVLISYKGPVFKTVEIRYYNGPSMSCGWGFKEGKEITVFADGNLNEGFKTRGCMMIPFGYGTASDDKTTYQSAIEAYRAKRASLMKAPVTLKRLREQTAFFLKYQDYDDAEASFNKLLAKRPKDIQGLIGRADMRYKMKRYEQALADYRAAIRLKTDNKAARHGKTLTLLKLGRMNELEKNDRDFSGYKNEDNESKPSFAGLDLVGANFSHVELYGIDFSGADLTNADFSEAILYHCNFSGAKRTNTKFYTVKEIPNIN